MSNKFSIKYWNHAKGVKKVLLQWDSFQAFNAWMQSLPLTSFGGRFTVRDKRGSYVLDHSDTPKEEIIKEIQELSRNLDDG